MSDMETKEQCLAVLAPRPQTGELHDQITSAVVDPLYLYYAGGFFQPAVSIRCDIPPSP